MIPHRRRGEITEYQNGHYFMYVTEWQEQQKVGGGKARRHREIEIYYAKARVVRNLNDDPMWNTTDPHIFEKALALFESNPAAFEKDNETGKLPADKEQADGE